MNWIHWIQGQGWVDKLKDYSDTALALISAGMAVAFIIEMVGVARKSNVTITEVTRSYVPLPLRAFAMFVLFWHFCLAGWITNRPWYHLFSHPIATFRHPWM